jgi:biopolymer transport protein ExbB
MQELNLASQLLEGGTGVIVIGGLSVLALAVSLERLANFRAAKVAPQDLANEALGLWQAGDYQALAARAGADRSSLARVLEFLAGHPRLPIDTLSARAADIASTELRLQQQKAYALNVVATIAPIVGLLGTVIGMIEAFHVIAFNGMGDPTLLAGAALAGDAPLLPQPHGQHRHHAGTPARAPARCKPCARARAGA